MQALTVPTIFKAVDRFTATVLSMKRSVVGLNTTVAAGNARFMRSMENVSSNAKSIARTSAVAGLAILTPLIYAAREAAKFEHSMAQINTIAGLSGSQLVQMNQQVLDITRKIPVSYDDIKEGLYILNSSGIKGAKGYDAVRQSAKLAVGGIGSVKEATQLMAAAFTIFGGEGLTMTQIYNKMAVVVKMGNAKISQMTEGFGKNAIAAQLAGVKLNEFGAMTAALTVKGSSPSEAYTQIGGAVQAMIKPSQSMIKAFHEMGFKGSFAGQNIIKKFNGQLVPAMEAVNKTLDKLGIRRAKAWSRVSALVAESALTPGGKANAHYRENMIAMVNQPNTGDNMFQTMLGTTENQFKLLTNNLKSFAIEIGLHLLPSLTKVAQKLSPIIDGLMKWMDANPGLTDTIIKVAAGIGTFLIVVAPVAYTVGLIADAFYFGAAAATFFGLALESTPIGWIITGVAALIALITVVVSKWDSWGAAVSVFMGPLGAVISLIQSFRRNWDLITKAFKTEGILGGLKMIGKVILDSILMPMEQLLAVIGKLTGWNWAVDAANGMHLYRQSMGVYTGDKQSGSTLGTGELTQYPTKNRTQFITPLQVNSARTATTLGTPANSLLEIVLHAPEGYKANTKISGPIPIKVKIGSTTAVGIKTPAKNNAPYGPLSEFFNSIFDK